MLMSLVLHGHDDAVRDKDSIQPDAVKGEVAAACLISILFADLGLDELCEQFQ